MKTTTRSFVLAALAFCLSAGVVFGQGFAPKRIWTLTVNVDVPGAIIYVDNDLVQGNRVQVSGGAHNVKVHADGYFDFVGPVTVTGNQAFSVQMRPQLFPLSIRVNVAGAAVVVDGARVAGPTNVSSGTHNVQVTAPGFQDYVTVVNVASPMNLDVVLQPQARMFPLAIRVNVAGAIVMVDGVQVAGPQRVPAGSHEVQVTAPGFSDYFSTVNVAGPMAVDVALQPAGMLLTVNANVVGALVTVNNVAKGAAPYAEALPPGNYTVRVSANGYNDYITTVSLNQPMTLNAQLERPLGPPLLTFVFAPTFLDPDVKANDPQGSVKIFVDNRRVNPNQQLDQVAVSPGRHRIRVASGAFSVQLGDMDFQAGMSYSIELTMGLGVRAVKVGQ
jgi:hypothetical protein